MIYQQGGTTWYYKFMRKGETYRGTCTGCKSKRDAELFEKRMKEEAAAVRAEEKTEAEQEKFHKAELKRIQRKRKQNKILLTDAFSYSMKKKHEFEQTEKRKKVKESGFNDFIAFLSAKYPDVKYVDDVERKHAEEYVVYFEENGRFNRSVEYEKNGRKCTYEASGKPSPATVRFYHGAFKELFRVIAGDANIAENPFNFKKTAKQDVHRKSFSNDELQTIFKHLDSFTKPLFVTAMFTGLREGDICTLKWSDIDFENNVIYRIQRKLEKNHRNIAAVNIRLIPDFRNYLLELKEKSDGNGYVFPEHAEMYLKRGSDVSYRVKTFLEKIGIETTETPTGRSRAISVKDLHSMRHTYATILKNDGVPVEDIRKLCGHANIQTTMIYFAHEHEKSSSLVSSSISGKLHSLGVNLNEEIIDIEAIEPEADTERKQLEAPKDGTVKEKLIEYIKALSENQAAELYYHLKNM